MKMPVMSDRKRALARGSRMTVYRPGSSAFGFLLPTAFFDATSVYADALIWPISRTPVMPAQPDPEPSFMRHVRMKPVFASR